MTERQMKFLKTHIDKAALDMVQMNLYITICKLLEPELMRVRLKNLGRTSS